MKFLVKKTRFEVVEEIYEVDAEDSAEAKMQVYESEDRGLNPIEKKSTGLVGEPIIECIEGPE